MGFQFRHRVELNSGIRANPLLLDGSHPYFDNRLLPDQKDEIIPAESQGAIRTLSLPGVGFAFSKHLASLPTAHESIRKQEAMRLEEHATRQQAEEEHQETSPAAVNAARLELLETWREEILYTPPEAYRQAVEPLPYKDETPPPSKPNVTFEKVQFTLSIFDQHLARQPVPLLFKVCIVAGSLLAGLLAFLTVGGFLGTLLGLVVTAVVCGVAWLAVTAWWSQEFKASVMRQVEEMWPQRLKEIIAAYDEKVQQHKLQTASAREGWQQSELQRTEFCQLLLDGETEAANTALQAHLTDLNFPLATRCDCAVIGAGLVLLNLELPGIEEVFPEMEHRRNARGEVTQVKRPQYARYEDYAQLTTGLTLWIVAAAFSAVPAAAEVKAGVYTRRTAKAETTEEYILNATFERSMMKHIHAIRNGDPLVSIANANAQFQVLQNGKLKTVPRPDW